MTERLLLSLSEGLRSSQVELMVKNLPAHAGDANDVGSIPGAGNGNPLQYSCLENSMDKRSLAGYSPWGRKESDMTDCPHTYNTYRGIAVTCKIRSPLVTGGQG